MALPTREIIEAFIIRNNVDVDAANSLRDQRPDVQQEVLGRGDVVRHRNPSAALQKHIKEAKLLMNSMARTRHDLALGEMQQFGPATGYGFSDPLYTYAVGAPPSVAPARSMLALDSGPTAAGPRGRGRGRSPSRSPSFGSPVWAQHESPSPEKEMCANPIFGRRAGAAKAQAEDESLGAARERSRKKSRNRSKSRRKGDEKKARDEERRSRQEDKAGKKDKQRRFQEEELRRVKDGEQRRSREAEPAKEQRGKRQEKRRDKSDERRQRKNEAEQQLQHLEENDPGRKAQSDSQAGGVKDIRQRIDDLQRRQDDRKRRRDEVARQLQQLEEDVREAESDMAPAVQDGSTSKVQAERESKRKAS